MLNCLKIVFSTYFAFSAHLVYAEFALDAQTEKLVDCGDVMAYASRYYLMMNNEGMARNLIQEFSKAQVALLVKNNVNGVVTGDRIAAFKSRQKSNKAYLDSNQNNMASIVNSCQPIISRAANDPSVINTKMWGKNYYELVGDMSSSIRSQYGLH